MDLSSSKISGGQVVCMLFLARIFNVLNYVPALNSKIEGTAMLYGTLIAFIMQLVIIIPALLLLNRCPGENVIQIAYRKSKAVGIILTAFYLLNFLFIIIGSLIGFEYFMIGSIYPTASITVIVVSMCVVCFFCAGKGIEGFARASTIIFVFFLVSTLFISLVSISSMNMLNIKPIIDSPLKSSIICALEINSKSPELYLLILLFPKISGSIKKSSITFITLSFVISELIIFLILSVLGEYGMTQTFPYFSLTTVIDFPVVQRLDSLHMIAWVFISFVRITLYIIIANQLLQSLIPEKARKISMPSILILTTVTACILAQQTQIFKSINMTSSILVVVLTAVVPLIALLFTKKKENNINEDKEDFIVAGGDA